MGGGTGQGGGHDLGHVTDRDGQVTGGVGVQVSHVEVHINGISVAADATQTGRRWRMRGDINSTYATYQYDMFSSGLAAEIGPNCLSVWLAVKAHANFDTGEAWPGTRRLATQTGLSTNTVTKCLSKLVEERLLRAVVVGKGRKTSHYVARERLDVKLGSRVICRVVIDYTPGKIRRQLKDISNALKTGEHDPVAFADCEVIPGPGFVWDPDMGVLKAAIPVAEIPHDADEEDGFALLGVDN